MHGNGTSESIIEGARACGRFIGRGIDGRGGVEPPGTVDLCVGCLERDTLERRVRAVVVNGKDDEILGAAGSGCARLGDTAKAVGEGMGDSRAVKRSGAGNLKTGAQAVGDRHRRWTR